MSLFVCPVCGKPLNKIDKSLLCESGHCFDIARQHYVNLSLSRKSSVKRHGDDKMMILARTRFLNKDYYKPLLDDVNKYVADYCKCNNLYGNILRLLDAGCGEGYYTDGVFNEITNFGKMPQICGIDISKDALISAAKRNSKIEFAVSGVNHIPLADKSTDIIINIFAPHCETEFSRILKDNGIFIKVVPLENHLFGLKKSIYEKPYLNPPVNEHIESFMLTNRTDLKYSISLTQEEDIENLFKMTPYYYKTGIEDQQKLLSVKHINTEIEFGILVYKKKL